MSGIVGSYHNIRGSGIVAKLGTDGQVFTSAGAGIKQTFEAAPGGGKIAQIVQTVNDAPETATSATFVDITDMSVAITPAATSSKIMIYIFLQMTNTTHADQQTVLRIDRDGTAVGIGESAGNRLQGYGWMNSHESNKTAWQSTCYLDSPSSTDEVTYTVQWATSIGTIAMNRTGTDGDNTGYSRGISTITAWEVLA